MYLNKFNAFLSCFCFKLASSKSWKGSFSWTICITSISLYSSSCYYWIYPPPKRLPNYRPSPLPFLLWILGSSYIKPLSFTAFSSISFSTRAICLLLIATDKGVFLNLSSASKLILSCPNILIRCFKQSILPL